MNITDTFSGVETATKPISRRLQQGKDFQILGEAFGHTTISICSRDDEKILMCQGHDLLPIGIRFKAGMILEKHTTSIPARLVVLQGEVAYVNALGSIRLKKHDQYAIPVDEPHWVIASRDSHIILIKNQQS